MLEEKRPRYYVTPVTAPTLRNDMYGVFLARSMGATTVAFGTHVTPIPRETMRAFPALDFALRGEPELTLRELLDTLDSLAAGAPRPVGWPEVEPDVRARLQRLFADADPDWRPAWTVAPLERRTALAAIRGLVWREGEEIVVNPDQPFIRHLDDLPLPRHDLLPLQKYRAPLVGGPYTFVVTSRGCPGGCRFCIKHVSYGQSVRFRSPENILAELEMLISLGIRHVHMYADLFTVSREQVMGLCEGILERKWRIRWTCNSRVDFVDPEMLQMMARAGCWMISWGIESGSEEVLRRAGKGIRLEQVEKALRWAKGAGIRNWGYFIMACPGRRKRPSGRPSAYRCVCRWTWRYSISPRRIPALRFSLRWWRRGGSVRAPAGRRWIWTAPRCWITRICGRRTWSGGRGGRFGPGRCGPGRP